MISASSTTLPATTLRTGKTVVDVSGLNDSSHSVAITSAGAVQMVGLTSDGDRSDYAVVSLTPDGQRNFSYDHDGIERLPAVVPVSDSGDLTTQPSGQNLTSQILNDNGTYNLSILALGATANDRPSELLSVAIPAQGDAPAYSSVQALADGMLLASARSDTTLTLVRFNDQGALDQAFGQGGIATFALPDGMPVITETSLALQSNGDVLLAGYRYPGGTADFSLTRYHSDGTLDTRFGTDGTVTVDVADGNDYARVVTQQADGKLLIAGTSDKGDNEVGDGNFNFSVVRLNADGSLDTSFGDGGKAMFDFEGGRDGAQTITVLDDGKLLLTGAAYNADGNADFAALRLNADGTLDTSFGDPVGHLRHINGQDSNDLIVGTAADEAISGDAGNDLLDGGGGRDQLSGGAGSDVFRFSSREDSYRTDSESFSDHITDFNPVRDVLDLAALGYTGLGDGYGNTLALRVDAEANRTYLTSMEPNADGHRFELVLNGDLSGQLDEYHLLFAPYVFEGADDSSSYIAGSVTTELLGKGGDDRLYGGLGNDILDGGAGRDILFGSEGADTYRFTSLSDSYRDEGQNFSDRIADFDVFNDRIDVSALGFTTLGDGHDGTLALMVNDDGTTTYLKSFDANAQGERFEVSLRGDLSQTLSTDAIIFAQPDSDLAELALLGVAGGHQEAAVV
ncbi:M10 family metallopeptidase C-terminal domain-containing protein [Pseudomonas japonica]|uniref:M10 family metallopeptidase C-terminal domain-containing protein n=1 Tax=Pseudomonas japonica TaxID=256466 RepID=UPI0015E2F100|nr:type I secretion target [Pseudomonas japonica]MBA1289573.1 type I secretion target [Pseudomonas japonica]